MKKFLSLVLALVMTMSLVTISAGAKDFTDSDSVTYTEAVDVLSAVKVVDGYTDGAFKPTTQLNRGQAAKILCNMILGPTTANALKADAAPFKDVAADNTFAAYIAYCAKEGIIDGYTDGTFRPTAPLTGYAFMKLLLGALGYDKDVEGYNGANWSINVAKRALNVGLDKGLVEDFDGTKIVTREEACLFALNTLKADMVEYGTKTAVNVGGAEVVIAGSTAKVVENNGKTDGNIDDDGDMQFAEKYFTKLELNDSTTDDFMRPASKWTFNGTKVGTYTDTPDAEYYKDTKLSDIYADLDLDKQIDAKVYRNGQYDSTVPVARGIKDKLSKYNSIGGNIKAGNGLLTEVYYDRDAGTIRIVEVDTYVAEVGSVNEETKAHDAYITLAAQSGPALVTDRFETDEAFEVDDVVLYTYANSKIQAVKKADSKEGVLNTIYLDSKINLAGETYSESLNTPTAWKADSANMNVKSSYVVYFDDYGYFIYAKESEHVIGDYAFVEATASTGWAVGGDVAKLVYLDGTTSKVDTAKDYNTDPWDNYLVTFSTNTKNETTLKKVPGTTYAPAGTDPAASGWYNAYGFYMKNGDAQILIRDVDDNAQYTLANNEARVFANSKSVIVVKNTTTNKYKAYTGVKAMPSINLNGGFDSQISITYYCKSGEILTYAFIQAPGAAITGGTEEVTFLSGKSLSKHTTDTDLIPYYTYNAVVNGEITTVRVDAEKVTSDSDVIYNSSSINTDNIVIDYTNTTLSDSVTGIKKLTGEHTLGFKYGARYDYYTVANDCKVFFVNADGDITATTTSAVVSDASQSVSYVLNDSFEVKYLFLNENDTTQSGSLIGGGVKYDAALVKNGLNLDLNLTSTAGTPATSYSYTIYAKNTTSGYESVVATNGSASTGTWTSGAAKTSNVYYGSNNNFVYWAKVVIDGETIMTGVIGG